MCNLYIYIYIIFKQVTNQQKQKVTMQISKEELEEIYEMVDNIPFSRPKKNIHRDFADGVMMAELLHHYFPKLVELHNYPQANSQAMKFTNWETLNTKILKKIGISLKRKEIQNIVNCVPFFIENLLKTILTKVQHPLEEIKLRDSIPTNKIVNNEQDRIPKLTTNNKAGYQFGNDTEVEQLQQKIEKAYMQLLKLQQISHLKDGVIKNLQKKVQTLL